MKNDQSIEDYLEAIHILAVDGSDVHRAEVARRLGVSQPAVTKAVKRMCELGYVRVEGMHICLTESGAERAAGVYEKHRDIREFLLRLGVSESVAETDACRIEHVVCEETYDAIKKFIGK